ncbi:CRISPR-associated protein Cas4 [Natranaerofaba carboxydovora]|uniref:CRISPR-associated protein Cas4 n=1 Tax=Natranaerofaba carboxydovora TaxID=2742683 RepID=UPI003B848842
MAVTATHIWYYFICKREVWLLSRGIAADQEDENLDLGRFIDRNTYQKNKKEIVAGNIKVDRVRKEGEEVVVGEVKKSSRFKESSRYQLLFYLDSLRQMGIEARGELLFPQEKKREKVEWTEEKKKELDKVVEDIRKIAKKPVPPAPKKINFCKKCAYREYCWAEG